jgi:phospholipid/cholesterol/gamma-HCH transport system substrate-binding protein
VQQPGGVLDQVQQSVQSVAAASQSLQQGSVVRINRLLDSADKTSRQLGHAVSTLDDNPQTLLYGPPWVMPGPGEPGFVAPRSTP